MSTSADVLGQKIVDELGVPKDAWEITAQLEVRGLRDTDAPDYGVEDLFALGRMIYDRFEGGHYRFSVAEEDPLSPVSPVRLFLSHYLTGLTFSLPMALQAVTMLVWGYGIWGAKELDLETASAIALGFITSYVVAGGFSQAIVRRGLFYLYQGEMVLAKATALRQWRLSVLCCLLLLGPGFLLNLVYHFLPWPMMMTAAAYYVGLVFLWLSWALIYLLRKTFYFVVLAAIGLGAVLFAAYGLHFSAIEANMVGLVVTDALSIVVAFLHLERLARQGAASTPVNAPRLTILVYSTSRFFLYGFLYNTFLIADRIMAWTTSVGRIDSPPYGFWLSVPYELGMDLALVVVMVLAGVIEFTTQRFSQELILPEKRTKNADGDAFIEWHRDVRGQRVRLLWLWSVPAVVITAVVFTGLHYVPDPKFQRTLTAPATTAVFLVAVVAYVLFMFALQNILILLTLTRVELAGRCVAQALMVNLVVGFILSRAVHYSAAVYGLLAGSIALVILSRRAMATVLDRLDYYYYSAY